ncbi:MAG: M15 family metallopeptidase, partial [Actinomycetota bacterium]|nr:M15 family metallopeptidase [Actinomycetota bacterium]
MLILCVAAVLSAACSSGDPVTDPSAAAEVPPAAVAAPTTAPPTSSTAAPMTTTTIDPRHDRPTWLGTPLTELRPGTNYGVAQPTPPELVDRRLATIDILPPPADDQYVATIGPVPEDVVARSTFTTACPVTLDELRYLTMTFWGFDEMPHTGEMVVNASIADLTVDVFEQLYELRYPIEDMSVMPAEFWTRTPSGDDNITSSFECRAAVGGSGGWSNHAFGLAIDINPFHNPYRKGTLILPELADAYFDRA